MKTDLLSAAAGAAVMASFSGAGWMQTAVAQSEQQGSETGSTPTTAAVRSTDCPAQGREDRQK
jgi:hypothetical protein